MSLDIITVKLPVLWERLTDSAATELIRHIVVDLDLEGRAETTGMLWWRQTYLIVRGTRDNIQRLNELLRTMEL